MTALGYLVAWVVAVILARRHDRKLRRLDRKLRRLE